MRPRQLWDAWKAMGPFRRSHHPHCGPFRADVLLVGGRRWCIACWFGYPAIVLTFLAGLLVAPPVPWWALAAGGLVVASVQALSFAGAVPSWRIQVGVKVLLGIGIGAFAYGLWRLPLAVGWRLLVLWLSLMAVQSLWLLRFHRLDRTCQTCPQLALRPRCEGLSDLDDRVGGVLRLPGR